MLFYFRFGVSELYIQSMQVIWTECKSEQLNFQRVKQVIIWSAVICSSAWRVNTDDHQRYQLANCSAADNTQTLIASLERRRVSDSEKALNDSGCLINHFALFGLFLPWKRSDADDLPAVCPRWRCETNMAYHAHIICSLATCRCRRWRGRWC